ncbi:MAG: YitT family protein [Lactobacillales bacterium]|jgi:uncharacterized membrane-anchored protein YitT (DUF2179 family)|nr:YitT family protein [Lactobacillales bacterium]
MKEVGKRTGTILLAGIFSAIGLNFFLIPAGIFSAGVSGISQLLQIFIQNYFHISINTGIIILLVNIPILLLSHFILGRNATAYTMFTVFAISFFTTVFPIIVLSDNILMDAVIGGVFIGIAAGFCMKSGFSTGGLDVISIIFNKTTGKSVGKIMLVINAMILLFAGICFGVEVALYSFVSIFALTRAIDVIYSSEGNVTAFIVTHERKQIREMIYENFHRGITIYKTIGGFEEKESETLMVVLTRREVFELTTEIGKIDPNAFIDVFESVSVVGNYSPSSKKKRIAMEEERKARVGVR